MDMPSLKEAFKHLLVEAAFDIPEEEPQYFEDGGMSAHDYHDEQMEGAGQKFEMEDWMATNAAEYEDAHQMVYDAAESIGGPGVEWIFDPSHWIYEVAQDYVADHALDPEYWRNTREESMYNR